MLLSQSIIIEKLSLYLELKNNPDANRIIRNIQWGICFGYSVCYRAMEVAGKLRWWQGLLEAIAGWDGQRTTLLKKFSLPDQESEPLALYKLMERACHYLLFNCAYNGIFPYLTSFSQLTHLKVGGTFEMLKGDSLISVQHFVTWAGNLKFDSDGRYLARLLKTIEPVSKDNIFLAGNFMHACTFWFDRSEGGWYFFDPDCLDGEPKRFINHFQLGSEMKKRLGEDIVLWFALLTDNAEDKRLLEQIWPLSLLPDLLSKGGMSIMAVYAPQFLLNFLASASTRGQVIKGFYEQKYAGLTLLNWLFKGAETETLVEFFAYLPAQPDYNGNTCLHYAVLYGHTQLISLLIQAGFNLNLQNAWKVTPLVFAVLGRSQIIVKSLLENGADPNIGDNAGNTPLIWAVLLKDLPIIKLLLERRADLDKQNQKGETALMLAAYWQQTEIVKLLLDAGANPFIKNNRGLTVFNNRGIVKVILNKWFCYSFERHLLLDHRLILSENEFNAFPDFWCGKIDAENLSKVFIRCRQLRKKRYFRDASHSTFFSTDTNRLISPGENHGPKRFRY